MRGQRTLEQRGLLTAVLECLDEAVVIVNASGEPLLTNAAYNRRLTDIGHPLPLLDEDGMPLVHEAMPQQRAARRERADLHVIVSGPDARHRLHRVAVRPIHPPGPRGEVGVVAYRDRSDWHLRLLEEQLVAHVAHELRTPLSGLLSHAEVLLDYLSHDHLSCEARAAVERIRCLSRRLSSMIDDLLDVARVSSGTFSLAWETVDLHTVVTSAVEIARLLPGAPPMHIDASDQDIVLRGEGRRLGEAVLNLLTNAVKHGIGTHRIDVRLQSDEDVATIEVEDYGAGLPSDDVSLLFTKYYQVCHPDAEQRGAGGLGLGLYIAQQTVAAHGGTIDVASEPGLGTRFTIRLPLG